MAIKNLLLVGATGETGREILGGLLEDGTWKVTALVRPESAEKPEVQALKSRGVQIIVLDTKSPVEEVAKAIAPFDTIISAVNAHAQLSQIALVDAIAKAGTCKRFIPCGFTTVCPPSGVMLLRDWKEEVHQRIWYHHLPYTIVDVGFWHQISWPRVPSSRLDYAALIPQNTFYGEDDPVNLLTDKRDIGKFVAKIVNDERTINQKVFTHSDALSQKAIYAIVEKATGETVDFKTVSTADLIKHRDKELAEVDPMKSHTRFSIDYNFSKYIRGDNTPKNAEYLGYLDAKALYPDLKLITFAEYIDELVSGKAKRPYSQLVL